LAEGAVRAAQLRCRRETKSLSRTVERVNLSQSTVSQQIRRFEDIVGKSLSD
jgi:DNA-binding transcriptional LysR family regulator